MDPFRLKQLKNSISLQAISCTHDSVYKRYVSHGKWSILVIQEARH
jgi:hypothetical protein